MNELAAYDFDLPRELIAQKPLPIRTDSRLLVVRRAEQKIEHLYFRDLPELLRKGDMLVLNDTQVVPARLVGRRERTGARWTGLYLNHDETGIWQILSKTRGKLEAGEAIILESPDRKFNAQLMLLAKLENGMWAASPTSDEEEGTFTFLKRMGHVPLPPYIRDGEMAPEDIETYQTVYARKPGAVAAPTAGLHFTKDLLRKLKEQGIDQAHVTLHVGMGTFRPMQTEKLDEHVMHSEQCLVTRETCAAIQAAKIGGGRIVAVGTTVVRSLESASLSGELRPFRGPTDLFIRPPFDFHAVDALLTNFHLPKSTLLVLVRTFGGDALIKQAYEEAIAEKYRFYSYGDAMLIV